MLQNLLIPETQCPHEITVFVYDPDFYRVQDHGRLTAVRVSKHSLFSSQDHGRLSDKHISKHSPSPGAGTLKITVGCPLCTYPSIRNKHLHTCWTPARPPVLTPVPSQADHSRACLNLHHSDIQSTAQKSPCVNTLFEAIAKKNKNKKRRELYYRNISGEEFIFYYSFKLIPKNRRRVKLQALQF